MTENMKKFLELVSKNEELGKKLCEADKEAVIAMAKELGIALTNADFAQNNELSDDELDAVAGGGWDCGCFMGGGGTGDGEITFVGETVNQKTCACVLAGAGMATYSDGKDRSRCACALAGTGDER